MGVLDEAKTYLARGWPVIPCRLWFKPGEKKASKKPLVAWTAFEERMPAPDDLDRWWDQWPDAQVGMVTGPQTGIMVVDIDIGSSDKDILSLGLPPSLMVETPSGGRHVYLKYPKGVKVKTVSGFLPHIDIRGDGGFVVIPPSTYPDGRPYTWLVDPEFADIADCPESLLLRVKETESPQGRTPSEWSSITRHGAPEGERNHTATSLIGILLLHLPVRHWNSIAYPLVLAWNAKANAPPLPEYELLLTFNSIASKESKRRQTYVSKVPREVNGNDPAGDVDHVLAESKASV